MKRLLKRKCERLGAYVDMILAKREPFVVRALYPLCVMGLWLQSEHDATLFAVAVVVGEISPFFAYLFLKNVKIGVS